jgi:hypothetical protein
MLQYLSGITYKPDSKESLNTASLKMAEMFFLENVEPTVWNGCNVGIEQRIQRGNFLQDPNTGSLYCFLHKVFSMDSIPIY